MGVAPSNRVPLVIYPESTAIRFSGVRSAVSNIPGQFGESIPQQCEAPPCTYHARSSVADRDERAGFDRGAGEKGRREPFAIVVNFDIIALLIGRLCEDAHQNSGQEIALHRRFLPFAPSSRRTLC